MIKILFNSVSKGTVGAFGGEKRGMKKAALALTLVSALLLSLTVGALVVEEAKANPFTIFEAATPIPGTIPPIITMSSPVNNTAYASTTSGESASDGEAVMPMMWRSQITIRRKWP